MLPALTMALDGRFDAARVRQIVFLTDGAIGYEAEVMATIRRRLGDSRFFTIGIGSAPNSYFMRKAAEIGRGSYTYIGSEAQVAERMDRLLAKLENPALTDLQAHFEIETAVEVWPKVLGDLYLGEPVIVTARFDHAADDSFAGDEIRFTASTGAKPWALALPLAAARPAKGIARLWARAKIEALNDSRHEGAGENKVASAVLAVALEHDLVSAHTSFVAVEVAVARPAGAALERRAVAGNLPHGWDFEKFFGAEHALPAQLRKASAAGVQLNAGKALFGARGTTPWALHVIFGLAALVLALVALMAARRRPA